MGALEGIEERSAVIPPEFPPLATTAGAAAEQDAIDYAWEHFRRFASAVLVRPRP